MTHSGAWTDQLIFWGLIFSPVVYLLFILRFSDLRSVEANPCALIRLCSIQTCERENSSTVPDMQEKFCSRARSSWYALWVCCTIFTIEMLESNIFCCLQLQRLGSSNPFCEEKGCVECDTNIYLLLPKTFQQDPSAPRSTWRSASPVEWVAVAWSAAWVSSSRPVDYSQQCCRWATMALIRCRHLKCFCGVILILYSILSSIFLLCSSHLFVLKAV